MKNLCLLLVAFLISIGASAQTKSTTSPSKTHHEYSQKTHEMYVFKDGKLMMSKNGKESEVTQDVTLSNGTTIATDGKITWKDGKSEMLKNDEWVSMNGKVHSKSMKSSENWKKKSDTSMKK